MPGMATQTFFPALRYRDSDAALARLTEAFAAEPVAVHREAQVRIAYAEIKLGEQLISVGHVHRGRFPERQRIGPKPEPSASTSPSPTLTPPTTRLSRRALKSCGS